MTTPNIKNLVTGSTTIKPKANGTLAFRFVLRLIGREYVTHMEVDPENAEGLHGYCHGHYHGDSMLAGYEDLKARAAKEGLRVLDANGVMIPLGKL